MPKYTHYCLISYFGNSTAFGFVWGIHCVVVQDARNLEDMVDRAAAIAFQEGFCQGGDRFLVKVGIPFGTPGALSLLRIAAVFESGTKGA
ncbi:pyruvate kinase [Bartonella callosciuri]|uniref:Pyruvate kinase n=1 Tax=Bartonella callosciuri TaxID=686223 RepID=A0A840NY64_9HYPH|nr:pyruvate kinase [Bartonella callosciuri]